MEKRVAVIGAGISGLPVIRYLTEPYSPSSSSSSSSTSVSVMGFERASVVGGNWVYTGKTGIDVDGLPVHSSMYKNLRSNGPKDTIRYIDFPYKNKFPSYTGHAEITEYIESFADHFNLRQYIKFDTLVTKVTPLTPDIRDTRWEVTYCNKFDQSKTTTEEFDYVAICTGHTAVPYLPQFPGMGSFTGPIVHSHEYRMPESFKDKVVVCVGAGPSAIDIPQDVAKSAKRVILSKVDKGIPQFNFHLPGGILEKPGIQRITETSVMFTDGEEEQCDVIILCTGYVYSFPFLTEECGITLKDDGRRVTPLYKHAVNINHPTLFFVGIPDFCAAFNVYDIQALFAATLFKGEVTLPDKAEMLKDTEAEMDKLRKNLCLGSRHFHKLGPPVQSEYMDSLLEAMGKPKLPKGYGLIFGKCIEILFSASLTYRDDNYEVDGDTFRLVKKI